MGAYAQAADTLAARGLAVIPCGGDDGKRPLVKWETLTAATAAANSSAWAKRYRDANVAVLTGPSSLAVVDVDGNSSLAEAMERRCGPTPLVTRTPRGGTHLWYRAQGERTTTRLYGLAVDVRAQGGVIVAPPSVRPDGGSYEIIRGSFDDLERLPTAHLGSLPIRGDVEEGRRNIALFMEVMAAAHRCESETELLVHAEVLNESRCNPPLPHPEVIGVVRSAWKYTTRGRNWVHGGGGGVLVHHREVDLLLGNPDALCLLVFLRKTHAGTGLEVFPLAAKAMAEARALPGWGWKRIRAAADMLERGGHLLLERRGIGRGLPYLYRLADRAVAEMVPESDNSGREMVPESDSK
jgi:hypothetical protein